MKTRGCVPVGPRGLPMLALVALLLLVLLLGLTPRVCAQEEAEDEIPLKVRPYRFTSIYETVDAELCRFKVPENRSVHNGKQITLTFVRFPCTSDNPGSPIVYLAGGPGGSGTGTAEGTRFPLFMAMREIADVIAFDQRGTGMSTRPRLPMLFQPWQIPWDRPATREEMIRLELESARKCGQRWKEKGVDLSAYNTVESADDLEDLRRAIKADKISLWAISYGTHLALATLKRHEKSIDRVILAGLEGPDHTVKLPSYFQHMLEQIDAMLRGNPEWNRRYPDFLNTVKTVLERLEKKPVTLDVYHQGEWKKLTIGKFDVQLATIELLMNRGEIASIPRYYRSMLEGDFRDLARRVAGNRSSGTFSAMSVAMDAASGISPARLERLRKEHETTLLGGGTHVWWASMAEALGIPDLGDGFRSLTRSDVPALLLSGTLDGRTPVSNGEEVLEGLSNGIHIIIEGAGHSDPLFLSSPKIREAMLAFMKGEPVSVRRIRTDLPDFGSARVKGTIEPALLDRYLGEYRKSPEETWKIEKEIDFAGRHILEVHMEGDRQYTYPISDTRFFMDVPRLRHLDLEFVIAEGERRATHLHVIDRDGETTVMPRVETP